MSNEFEAKPEFDFDEEFDEEFDDAMEAFDEFEIVNEDVTLRTAVMQKENMIALLCIKSAPVGAAICRVDPREALPAVQIYDDPKAALHWFSKSLRTSKVNGWQLVYDGLPLQG